MDQNTVHCQQDSFLHLALLIADITEHVRQGLLLHALTWLLSCWHLPSLLLLQSLLPALMFFLALLMLFLTWSCFLFLLSPPLILSHSPSLFLMPSCTLPFTYTLVLSISPLSCQSWMSDFQLPRKSFKRPSQFIST